jgi:hypothetical protein
MQQMSDVEHLLAIEAIKDLQARRCHAVDTSDWAAYEVLDDGVPGCEARQLLVRDEAGGTHGCPLEADLI